MGKQFVLQGFPADSWKCINVRGFRKRQERKRKRTWIGFTWALWKIMGDREGGF